MYLYPTRLSDYGVICPSMTSVIVVAMLAMRHVLCGLSGWTKERLYDNVHKPFVSTSSITEQSYDGGLFANSLEKEGHKPRSPTCTQVARHPGLPIEIP
jgi:hypothetical protein